MGQTEGKPRPVACQPADDPCEHLSRSATPKLGAKRPIGSAAISAPAEGAVTRARVEQRPDQEELTVMPAVGAEGVRAGGKRTGAGERRQLLAGRSKAAARPRRWRHA